jgi:hypothetical protein
VEVDWNYGMQGKGVNSRDIRINWTDLAHFKRSFTDALPKIREAKNKGRRISKSRNQPDRPALLSVLLE